MCQVYVPAALSDYKEYLSKYYEWEAGGDPEAPKLKPLHERQGLDL